MSRGRDGRRLTGDAYEEAFKEWQKMLPPDIENIKDKDLDKWAKQYEKELFS